MQEEIISDALGGRDNVIEVGSATSRLWLRLADASRLDESELAKLGVRMVVRTEGAVQLLIKDAEGVAAALQPA